MNSLPDPAHVLFDNNVWGPIAAPDHYEGLQTPSVAGLRGAIERGRVIPYLSQSSLTIEALGREQRIHEYFRAVAARDSSPIPTVPAIRDEVISAALAQGFMILRVPRLGLPPFVEIEEHSYANERAYARGQRQERYSVFHRAFPESGLSQLKALGTEAAIAHRLRSRTHAALRQLGARTDHLPSEAESEYLQGIVAEFDNPRIPDNTRKKWTRRVRAVLAEMADADAVAAHYAYGTDVFCTSDRSGEGGASGILHPGRREELAEQYGLRILGPEELWESLQLPAAD